MLLRHTVYCFDKSKKFYKHKELKNAKHTHNVRLLVRMNINKGLIKYVYLTKSKNVKRMLGILDVALDD